MRADYIFVCVGLIWAIIGIVFIFKKPKFLNKIEIIWICALFFLEESAWGSAMFYKHSLLSSIFWAMAIFLFCLVIFFIIERPKIESRGAFILTFVIGTIYYLVLFSLC